MMKKHNFSAGPSILPQEVFKLAAEGVLNLNDSGLSVLEISHRSTDFVEILAKAKRLVKDLLSVPENYHILFLSGGASSQFFMTAMNCLPSEGSAAYVDTGAWSTKAIKEAGQYGNLEVLASSKDRSYKYIPKSYDIPSDASYLHLTSNNTIYGTQFHTFPETEIPIVCDMSSDIFSRAIDVSKFGIIYAGAQKNMGPAGTTVVIIRDDMVGRLKRDVPTMLNYETHVAKDSMFNTPPVFPIYVSMLTMDWLLSKGGVGFATKQNETKANLLYEEIDRNALFKGFADVADRSNMNVTFNLLKNELESMFLLACDDAQIKGVKGHRSVGGFRASIYNAMPLESVQVLVDVMKEFERKHG